MAIEFKEHHTLGNPWQLEVRSSGVVVGHVRRHPMSGTCRYFEGPHNELTPSFEDDDLDRLKDKIRASRGVRG